MKSRLPLVMLVMSTICGASLFACATSDMADQANRVVIEMPNLRQEVKPGDKPITLTSDLIGKLLPELTNPRLMDIADLKEEFDEQRSFLEEGCTFVLRGDFNSDGFADIVFVGKHDNPERPVFDTFISIISIKEQKVIRIYMSRINRDRIALLAVPEYKPGTDAIFMTYNFASDDCALLYWHNKEWQLDLCSHLNEARMKEMPEYMKKETVK